MKPTELKALPAEHGQKHSEILGIDLSEGTAEEVFKWSPTSILFGAPPPKIP